MGELSTAEIEDIVDSIYFFTEIYYTHGYA